MTLLMAMTTFISPMSVSMFKPVSMRQIVMAVVNV